jgi:hypothetical protein
MSLHYRGRDASNNSATCASNHHGYDAVYVATGSPPSKIILTCNGRIQPANSLLNKVNKTHDQKEPVFIAANAYMFVCDKSL